MTGKDPLDQLRLHVVSLPVHAYMLEPADDFPTFCAEVFGSGAAVSPVYAVDNHGVTRHGFTVMTTIIGTAGVFGFEAVAGHRDSGMNRHNWQKMSAGTRIDLLIHSTRDPFAMWAPTPFDMAMSMANTMMEDLSGIDWWDPESSNSLNVKPNEMCWARTLWRLRNILTAFTPDERASFELLVGMNPDSNASDALIRGLNAVQNVHNNAARPGDPQDDAYRVIYDAAHAHNGSKPKDMSVANSGLIGALFIHPYDDWPAHAQRLIEEAHEGGALPPAFSPDIKTYLEGTFR